MRSTLPHALSDGTAHLSIVSIECGPVRLRLTDEADDALLLKLLPDDFQHDPEFPRNPDHSLEEHRSLWMKSWLSGFRSPTPGEQFFPFIAEELETDEPVGFQLVECSWPIADAPVDSSSFVVLSCRGRGIGTSMRTAALGFAFGVLKAQRAVSSADPSNTASRRVSENCGYRLLEEEPSPGEFPSGEFSQSPPQSLVRYEISASEWFREHTAVLFGEVLRIDAPAE